MVGGSSKMMEKTRRVLQDFQRASSPTLVSALKIIYWSTNAKQPGQGHITGDRCWCTSGNWARQHLKVAETSTSAFLAPATSPFVSKYFWGWWRCCDVSALPVHKCFKKWAAPSDRQAPEEQRSQYWCLHATGSQLAGHRCGFSILQQVIVSFNMAWLQGTHCSLEACLRSLIFTAHQKRCRAHGSLRQRYAITAH